MNEKDVQINGEVTHYDNGLCNITAVDNGNVGFDVPSEGSGNADAIPNGTNDTVSPYGAAIYNSVTGSVSGGDNYTVSPGDVSGIIQVSENETVIHSLTQINTTLMLILFFLLFEWTGRKFREITVKIGNRRLK